MTGVTGVTGWRGRAAAGVTAVGLLVALAGCGGNAPVGSVGKGAQVAPPDLIFAFNKGDNTISVIDPSSQQVKVVQTVPFSAYGLYPSNQWGLQSGYLMLPQPGKVTILRDKDLKPVATIPLSAAKGLWTAILPDGKTGVTVARETDQVHWVNMDPTSREFGAVIRTVTVPGKVGLCDVSIDPAGHYAYIPDLYKSKLQVIDLSTGKTVYLADSPVPKAFMGTVSWDGKIWAVEGSKGNGEVAYLSLADPTKPTLLKVLDQASGLGLGPHTDEFRPDNRYDFVLSMKSSEVSVVDTSTLAVVKKIELPPGGQPRVGAFSYHGNFLYVSLEGVNSVAVIDTHKFTLTKVIKVGKSPVGIAATRYAWASHA